MATLKDNEIRIINDIILELYNTETRESMERKFLKLISALIPYKMSNFCVKTDRSTENLLDNEVVFVGAEDEIISEFTKSVELSKNYLFRGEEFGDFTEKEVFILDLFKNHLAAIIFYYMFPKVGEDTVLYNGSNGLLTKRELEIIPLLLSGYSNDKISEELCITLSTTKKHVYNIFRKYDVNSRAELIQKLRNI